MACTKGYILVVDDDADTRIALKEHIEALGCPVVTAVDGLDAIAQLEDRPPPCLVLLDHTMPRLNGNGFASWMKQRFKGQPIVSMSADPRSLRAACADGYLDKPFHPSEVTAAIAPFCPSQEITFDACAPSNAVQGDALRGAE